MRVYITKFALAKGILIAESEDDAADGPVKVKSSSGYVLYFHHGEWHPNLGAAKAKAMDMILAKEKSLNKQMAKLTKLAAMVPVIVEENLKRL